MAAQYTWENVKQNWYDHIAPLYGEEFPIEIRSLLSDSLSNDKCFMNFNLEEPNHRACASAFVGSLLIQLRNQIEASKTHDKDNEANFYHKQRLDQILQNIQTLDPLRLYKVIRDSLKREKQKIGQLLKCCKKGPAEPGGSKRVAASAAVRDTSNKKARTTCPNASEITLSQTQRQIDTDLKYIQQKCQDVVDKTQEMWSVLQYLQFHFFRHQQGNAVHWDYDNNMPLPSREELDNLSAKLSLDLRGLYDFVFVTLIPHLSTTHDSVLKELEKWRDEQRLIALGKTAENGNLEAIEKWFEIMGNCLTILEHKLPEIKNLCVTQNLLQVSEATVQETLSKIKSLRQDMMNVSLVITQEPKQSIRPGVRFGPIHLTVLPFSTNMMITEDVKVVFMNEATAIDHFSSSTFANKHEKLPADCGTLIFGSSNDPFKLGNKIEYQTVTVKLVEKSAERGKQCVADEKFWIFFRVKVNYDGNNIFLSTTSHPISVTSHTVQVGKAWASLVWYNASPFESHLGFRQAPDSIPWTSLIEAINLSFINLGKELTAEQKSYLKLKLFRENVPKDGMVNKHLFLTDIFSQYQVDPEAKPEGKIIIKQFTYGEWLFGCLKILEWVPQNGKLVEYGVRKFWSSGNIAGFMSKKEIQIKLGNAVCGNFIIRFPENRPEHICLYFYDPSADSKDHLLKQLYSINDFKIKALQDRILESSAALYLHPNIDKADVFTRLSESDCSIVDGYFSAELHESCNSEILKRMQHLTILPSSSHSALAYRLSQGTIVVSRPESIGSVHSGHSSNNGGTSLLGGHSPERGPEENMLEDLSPVPSVSPDFWKGGDRRYLGHDDDEMSFD